jgi:hypothetical protein
MTRSQGLLPSWIVGVVILLHEDIMSKKLTFETARTKLDKIANGEYRSIAYEITETGLDRKIECTVYINGKGRYSGETWEEAFRSLRKSMRPEKKASLDQAPE